MKRITLTLFLVSSVLFSFAQLAAVIPNNYLKGTYFARGSTNLGFYSNKVKEDDSKTSGLNLNLGPGYFVFDQFAAGLDLNLSMATYKDKIGNEDIKNKYSSFSAGPWLRGYFPIKGLAGSPYGMLDAGWGSSKWSGDSFSGDNSYSIGYWDIGLGYAIPLCCDCVEFDFGFSYGSLKEVSKDNSDDTFTRSGLKFDLGFSLHFPGRHQPPL